MLYLVLWNGTPKYTKFSSAMNYNKHISISLSPTCCLEMLKSSKINGVRCLILHKELCPSKFYYSFQAGMNEEVLFNVLVTVVMPLSEVYMLCLL